MHDVTQNLTSNPASALFQLLQQSIDEIQQGNGTRGIELLKQAREWLTVDDTILASIRVQAVLYHPVPSTCLRYVAFLAQITP